MYFAGFCAAMGKFTYWPLIFLPWINPVQRKYNKKGLISFNILVTFCMIAWNLFVVINVKGISSDSAVVPMEQLKYIFSHLFIRRHAFGRHDKESSDSLCSDV